VLGKGNLAEAEHHARNAVRVAQRTHRRTNLMGMILTETNRPQAGEYHYRRVLELTEQRDPVLLANLAWNLKNQGRMQEARTRIRNRSRARQKSAARFRAVGGG
jgi:Flp pilus assembly protein TadD